MNEAQFCSVIDYSFRRPELLIAALTHSSWANEKNIPKYQSNERLEFLGDAILEGFVSEELFSRLPDVEEGVLTRLRAVVVCEKSLCCCAGRLDLGSYLNLGRGEEQSGGRQRPSILADAMEAVIGAIYLDGGREASQHFLHRVFDEEIETAIRAGAQVDYKSKIQELLQAGSQMDIRYEVRREQGPDHDKTFYVNLLHGDRTLGRGQGKSKKEAEQNAARNALNRTAEGDRQDVF